MFHVTDTHNSMLKIILLTLNTDRSQISTLYYAQCFCEHFDVFFGFLELHTCFFIVALLTYKYSQLIHGES